MKEKKFFLMSDTVEIILDVKIKGEIINHSKQALLLHIAGIEMEKLYEGGEWGDWPQSNFAQHNGVGVYRVKGQ